MAFWLLLTFWLSNTLLPPRIPTPNTGLIILCLVTGALGILPYRPGKQFYSTLAVAILVFSAATVRLFYFKESVMPGPKMDGMTRMSGQLDIVEVLKEKENSVTLKCRNLALCALDHRQNCFSDEFLVLYIKEHGSAHFLPGDRLIAEGWVSPIRQPMNPHAFDIRVYYQSIGIRHQMNCKGEEIFLQSSFRNSLFRMTARWQKGLCKIISDNTSRQVAQLTNALVWGDRTNTDEEIREAFADSGAMHVLSVSGMHMAIVYSMLYILLGAPGSGILSKRILRFCLYASAILLYMGLTGACPAVVRSGLMIILFLLGKAMGWNTQIWNLLGFAASVMLWMNPLVMHNTGFQLSFLAMAGILLYAKPMIRYFSFRHIVLHRIWEVTAVSIAAQVFIFPLLLLQFYQFPLTFILSSLVAMPASYIIIFGALLNTCLAFLEWSWLWKIYDLTCHYFLLSMKWMAGLNPSMNYSMPSIAGILLTGMAIVFSVALIYRWPKGKNLAYFLGLCALINLGWHRRIEWHRNELIIYHQYQGMLIDVVVNGHCFSIQDSLVNAKNIEFAARGHRCFKDIISVLPVLKTEGFHSSNVHYDPPELIFGHYRILIWQGNKGSRSYKTNLTHIVVDNTRNASTLKKLLCDNLHVMVILPAHLNRYGRTTMLKFLKENNIPYHDIADQGYMSLAL
jgi:competence protein ComEC